MDVSIKNSKFSSLSFRDDWQTWFDTESCYIQKFAAGEEIRIQFTSRDTGFEAKYINENEAETDLTGGLGRLKEITDGETTLFLFEIVFTVNTPGLYRFELTSGLADPVGTCFRIKEKEELKGTVLLSYTHRKNEYDTMFFNSDGTRKTFNFRVEGGIYPGDKTQHVENEVFRDQRFNPHQTSAMAYEVSVLTTGASDGVPQWVGNKINNIFLLSDVEVDGIRSVRNESAAVELISTGTGNPLYVHKISIEQPNEDVHTLIDHYGFLTTNDDTCIKDNDKNNDNNNNYIKARIK
jgi:hypothetical protein